MKLHRLAGVFVAVLGVVPLLSPAYLHASEPMEQDLGPMFAEQNMTPEMRGDLHMAHRQYVAAIAAYEQSPQKTAMIWNKIGIAYHHMLAMGEAKAYYERALMQQPNYPEALNNLGAVYYEEKDYSKAEKLYRRALKLMPHPTAVVYSNLGTAYFAEGKTERGADAYRHAFLLDPQVFGGDSVPMVPEASPLEERAHLDYCLAELFAQAGMKDRAIEYLRKAMNEGFTDRRRLMHDQQFVELRKTAEFTQLLAEEKRP